MKSAPHCRWLMVIHLCLGMLPPLIVLFLTSCLDAEADKAAFGVENSLEAVIEALNEPFLTLNPENIHKGEFVHIETNQSISGGKKFVSRDTGITVISRVDDGSSIQFKLAVQEVTYSTDGTSQNSISESTVTIKKSSQKARAVTFIKSAHKLNAQDSIEICKPSASSAVTYHNLVTSKGTASSPAPAQGAATFNIAFDQVIHAGDASKKISCEYIYSAQVPFLAAQLKLCITMAIPVENRNVIMTECSEVDNFAFGSP